MKSILSAVLLASLSLASLGTQAAPAPLSCDMQTLLVGMTALNRDVGVPRKKSTVALNSDGELTKAEVKFILDKVYVQGVGKSPDEIKNDVYKKCKKGR